jgi:hypothetical protein
LNFLMMAIVYLDRCTKVPSFAYLI